MKNFKLLALMTLVNTGITIVGSEGTKIEPSYRAQLDEEIITRCPNILWAKLFGESGICRDARQRRCADSGHVSNFEKLQRMSKGLYNSFRSNSSGKEVSVVSLTQSFLDIENRMDKLKQELDKESRICYEPGFMSAVVGFIVPSVEKDRKQKRFDQTMRMTQMQNQLELLQKEQIEVFQQRERAFWKNQIEVWTQEEYKTCPSTIGRLVRNIGKDEAEACDKARAEIKRFKNLLQDPNPEAPSETDMAMLINLLTDYRKVRGRSL